MARYSKEILDKIELIKEIITSRSILRNIRDSIFWDVDISGNSDGIEELILYLKVIDQDCMECDFEPENILNEIHRYQSSVYNSINKLTFDNNLNIVKGHGSLRGILVSGVNYSLETITIEYGIFIDPV